MPAPPEVELDRARVRPGESVDGSLRDGAAIAEIALVRLERSPPATWEYRVGEHVPCRRRAGRFSLDVPEDAPPTVPGRRCSLTWAVRVTGSDGARTHVPVEVVEP